jgi:Na+-transporting NADH:ubiquinone oxidoreductase subunit C
MINKQSNVYTIIYITVMVIVVGAVLALTSMALKDRQNENAQADKKSQILQAVHIASERSTVIADFDKYIVDQIVVNNNGEEVADQVAFDIDVAEEAKKPAEERLLPVYICQLPDAGKKYILPLSGMGLWGPIWGYIAFDEDGSTVYGAFFDHQGETPGLGAEITKPAFTDQFPGRKVFKGENFYPIEVVKAGQKPMNADVDYVDGVSGGTVTSKGVSAMLDNCLLPYRAWLQTIADKATIANEQADAPSYIDPATGEVHLNASAPRRLTADDAIASDAQLDVTAKAK